MDQLVANGDRGPLSAEDIEQLRLARLRLGRVRRAGSYARFDGVGICVFAGLTILAAVFSPAGLLLGAPMAVIGIIELRAADRLRRLDPAALPILGFNQIAFAVLLILYGCWGVWSALTGPSPYETAAAQDAQVGQMLQPFAGLMRLVPTLLYGSLIAVAIFMQGGTAIYYFSRQRYLRLYLHQTPAWIVRLQRQRIID